jgi:hypothetical protein
MIIGAHMPGENVADFIRLPADLLRIPPMSASDSD